MLPLSRSIHLSSERPAWQTVLLMAGNLLDLVPVGQLVPRVLVRLNILLVPETNPVRGQLRDGPAFVRLGGAAHQVEGSEGDPEMLARQVLDWLNARLQDEAASEAGSALAREAFARLLAAHIFKDGNGRVARAVANWLLLRSGFVLRADPRGYTRCRKEAYYGALGVYPADAAPWNAFFEDLVAACYEPPRIGSMVAKARFEPSG